MQQSDESHDLTKVEREEAVRVTAQSHHTGVKGQFSVNATILINRLTFKKDEITSGYNFTIKKETIIT
jgi:hypothetical protein